MTPISRNARGADAPIPRVAAQRSTRGRNRKRLESMANLFRIDTGHPLFCVLAEDLAEHGFGQSQTVDGAVHVLDGPVRGEVFPVAIEVLLPPFGAGCGVLAGTSAIIGAV